MTQDAVVLAGFVKTCEKEVAMRQDQIKDFRQALAAVDAILTEARNEFALAKVPLVALRRLQ